jgi:hypothetical protein
MNYGPGPQHPSMDPRHGRSRAEIEMGMNAQVAYTGPMGREYVNAEIRDAQRRFGDGAAFETAARLAGEAAAERARLAYHGQTSSRSDSLVTALLAELSAWSPPEQTIASVTIELTRPQTGREIADAVKRCIFPDTEYVEVPVLAREIVYLVMPCTPADAQSYSIQVGQRCARSGDGLSDGSTTSPTSLDLCQQALVHPIGDDRFRNNGARAAIRVTYHAWVKWQDNDIPTEYHWRITEFIRTLAERLEQYLNGR